MLQALVSLFSIVISDLLLSGDNAVVIAMAAHRLPEAQRKRAIFLGAIGAVALRIGLTSVAFYLLGVPLLQAAGGLILLWIGARLLVGEEKESHVQSHDSLGAAIRTILVADLVMSLDNVLAVAGASHGNFWLLVVGLGLSMPPILFGAHFLGQLMDRAPWLMYVGSGILGWVGGQMLMEDSMVGPYLEHWAPWLDLVVPAVTTLAVLAIGYIMGRRKVEKGTAH